MSGTVFALPVSVEQIASVIKQMDQDERERLFDLVPELRQIAARQPSRTVEQAQATVAHLQKEVLAAIKAPLSPDEPFLGDLTLGQYHALPDEEKTRLWDEWAGMNLEHQEGDYLAWQERLFGDTSVDDLYEQAQEHWQRSQE